MMSSQQFCFWHLTAYTPPFLTLQPWRYAFSFCSYFFPKIFFLDETTFQNVCVCFEVFFIWYCFVKCGFLFAHKQFTCKCLSFDAWKDILICICFNLQCHLNGDVRSELFCLSSSVCVCGGGLWKRTVVCINVCLCMFVCVLVWGRKGAVGRKVRKNGIWSSQTNLFLSCFPFIFSLSYLCVFCNSHNIFLIMYLKLWWHGR